jgi:DNA-binding NtrC family response regulator
MAHRPKNSPAGTVLVVDDEWLVRWSLSESLRAAGHTVKVARDTREALSAFESSPAVNVVLLDLRLPDSSDLGLLKRFKALAPACAVILITAHRSHELLEQARQVGAFGVLDKPFDVDHVVALVAAALRSHRAGGAV